MKRDSSIRTRKRDVSGSSSRVTPGRLPLVFISHDSRDAQLAEAFDLLLADASGGMLKVFRSSDRAGTSGIEFGADWYATIMARLDEASDVVAILTPHSLERPWILYEVGIARGKLDHPAFGVAFGVPLEAISGPFAQFHNCGDDEESLTKLVLQLLRLNPLAEPTVEGARRQVIAFRQKLERMATATDTHVSAQSAPVANLFEEVKAMFEVLPSRLLTALDHRMPSVIDPAGPGWNEWLTKTREAVATMWSTQNVERAAHWRTVSDLLQEYVPRVSNSSFQIARALKQNAQEACRRAIDSFEAASAPYLDSPARMDQDAANILRIAMNALRHWVDTQPWSRRDTEYADR